MSLGKCAITEGLATEAYENPVESYSLRPRLNKRAYGWAGHVDARGPDQGPLHVISGILMEIVPSNRVILYINV